MSSRTSPRQFKLLLPAEAAALTMCFVAAALFLYFGIPARDPIAKYLEEMRTVLYSYPFMLLILFIIGLVQDGLTAKRLNKKADEKETWNKFCASYLNRSSLLRDFRLINSIMLMFVAFAHLKHVIPLVNPRIFDSQILTFERGLFGGQSATEIVHRLIPVSVSEFMSAGYEAYYNYLVLCLYILIMQRKVNLGEEFCLAFIMLWLVGIIMVYALPTLGPCFFEPSIVKNLPETEMTRIQADLWAAKVYLEQNPMSTKGLFSISGLPSLHLAVTILGSIYLAKLNRWLSVASWIFAGLTFLTTLYFGWHYLVDNIAAVALAWIAALLARSLHTRTQ